MEKLIHFSRSFQSLIPACHWNEDADSHSHSSPLSHTTMAARPSDSRSPDRIRAHGRGCRWPVSRKRCYLVWRESIDHGSRRSLRRRLLSAVGACKLGQPASRLIEGSHDATRELASLPTQLLIGYPVGLLGAAPLRPLWSSAESRIRLQFQLAQEQRK